MLLEQTANIADFESLLDDALERAGRHNRPVLVSYDLPLSRVRLRERIQQLSVLRNAIFFWKAGDASFHAVGAGFAVKIVADGPDRFETVRKDVDYLKRHFVTNLTADQRRRQPILLGAASFFPVLQDELWSDFFATEWFVPQMLLYERDGSTRAALQFLVDPDASRDHLVYTCERRLGLLEDDFSSLPYQNVAPLFLADEAADGREPWNHSVRAALGEISAGRYEKIVLSRMTRRSLHAEIDPIDWLTRLEARYPECHLYLMRRGDSTFLGASPERLVNVEDGNAVCNAMAGSTSRGSNESEDAALARSLLNSAKNRREHAYVVAHVREVMNRFCPDVQVDEAPSVRKLPYIQHLYSQVYGRIDPTVSPVDLAGLLHPTPAVGGYPTAAATDAIRALESYDRGLYAGFAGWFNFDGEGDFCVSIRSALAKGGQLYSFAGAGIVDGSDPDAEFDETEIKLRAIASLFST